MEIQLRCALVVVYFIQKSQLLLEKLGRLGWVGRCPGGGESPNCAPTQVTVFRRAARTAGLSLSQSWHQLRSARTPHFQEPPGTLRDSSVVGRGRRSRTSGGAFFFFLLSRFQCR